MWDAATNFEFFNIRNNRHLLMVDLRLNQNILVGQGVINMERAGIPYAGTRTIVDGFIAMVPRILWPGKPATAGGSKILSQYTQRKFSKTSTIGIGNILEFYISYGIVALVSGMICLGAAIRYLDILAWKSLAAGDEWKFTSYYLMGLALVSPGNNFSAILSAFAATVILLFSLEASGTRKFLGFPKQPIVLRGHGHKE